MLYEEFYLWIVTSPIRAYTAAKEGAKARVMTLEQDYRDGTALLRAANRLSAWKVKRLYDAQTGVLALTGEAVLALPETLREEFDQLADEIAESVGLSDQGRKTFAVHRAHEWQIIDLQVRRHMCAEIEKLLTPEQRLKE